MPTRSLCLIVALANLLAGGALAETSVWLEDLDLGRAEWQVAQPRARRAAFGEPLRVAGRAYRHGVGMHATTTWTLPLEGTATRLTGLAGVDDEPKTHAGSVEFLVLADGRQLWASGTMTTGDEPRPFDLDLTGAQALELRLTDAGDGPDSDHGDWLDARVALVADAPQLYPPGSRQSMSPKEWNTLSEDQVRSGHELTEVAPGVWKLTLGTPEALTPVGLRDTPPMLEALAELPPVSTVPVRPGGVGMRASARGCTVSLPLGEGEQLFGMGLQMRAVNVTGKRLLARVSDRPDSEVGDSHAPVPLYVSTAGYAVLVDTARYADFRFGTLSPKAAGPAATDDGPIGTTTEELYRQRESTGRNVVVEVPAARGVDVYLFAGPTMKDAIRRYNLFSGGGCLPPMWGIGVHYRGHSEFGAEESLTLARTFREARIPCDSWGLEPGWQTHAYACTFVWNRTRFPDPAAFAAEMGREGFRLNLWEHAFTHPDSPIYEAELALSGDYMVFGGIVPDFALPEAGRLLAEQHEREVMVPGVAAFKLDECDNQTVTQQWSFPEHSQFPSGLDGEQMHSMLGVLYQRVLLEPFRASHQRTYGLVRSSHALAAPLPYALYSDVYDHRDYVRALLTGGFSGLLWSPEVREARSPEELYRRLETVMLSPFANINGWYLREAPWQSVDPSRAAEVEDVVRGLCELRMSLLPYLYAAFAEYRLHGTPPFRHPVVDFPDDPQVAGLTDEYLVGDALLVAPLFAGETKRTVYLPDGAWYDFATHQAYDGGRAHEIEAAAERIPIFVRGGSILPLATPVQFVAPDTVFELTCQVYGDEATSTRLLDDDGETDAFEQGRYGWLDLTWDPETGGTATPSGQTAGRYRVVGWEQIGGR